MEYYHVADWRSFPVSFIATLVVGLPVTSRTKSGGKPPIDILLMAAAVDRLSYLLWAQTEDARKGRNRPASIYEELLGGKSANIVGFDSVEAFEAARAKLFG